MKHYLYWFLLVLWAGGSLAGLLYYSDRQLSWFDPKMQLSEAAASMQFDSLFVTALSESGVQPGTVVHFKQNNSCYCEGLTQPHHKSLASTLAESDYASLTIDLENTPSLYAFVPSTPAVAIVGFDGELRYFGPYATGYGCFTGKTLISTIARIATQPINFGAVVTTEAQGCFCEAKNLTINTNSQSKRV